MRNCKDLMVIHLTPSSPLREEKEEGVSNIQKGGFHVYISGILGY